MMQNTIEATYEYRVHRIVRRVLKAHSFKPNCSDAMFSFLEEAGADTLAQEIIADMVTWKDEEDWFNEITTPDR